MCYNQYNHICMQVEKIPAIVGGLGYSPADENKHQRYNGGGIHMGIFSRIGDIMKANVNDLIDRTSRRQLRSSWLSSARGAGGKPMSLT